MGRQQYSSGTLMRGPDGNLYYLPDAWLDSMRVPSENAERVQTMVEGEAPEAVHFAAAQLETLVHIDDPGLVAELAAQHHQGEE